MQDVIYWAVLLNDSSKQKLLNQFPPKHPKIFGEHMTIVFNPTAEQNKEMESKLGQKVKLTATREHHDPKGHAVEIEGFKRLDGGIPHITISCSPETKPVYSNALVSRMLNVEAVSVDLHGVIAAFTKTGWKT